MERAQTRLSIILPMLNEAENIPPVLDDVFRTLDAMGEDYEVIAVDDGSTDKTFEILQSLSNPRLKVLRFRRRFGQTAAMSAGFEHASGEIMITLDADGQNDPSDIPAMVRLMDDGADIVSGWRKNRHDTFLTRKVPSLLANWLISRVTGVRLHDYGCTLKAYRARLMRETRLYGELHRFVPALASWSGANVVEMVVKHHPRRHGRSKYGIGRTLRVVLDLITVKFLLSFGTRPIHMFGSFGIVSTLVGLAIGAYLVFVRIVLGQPIADRPLLLGAIVLVLVGFQFISMGLISELLVRIYHESSDKRTYAVAEALNFPPGRARTLRRESDRNPEAGFADHIEAATTSPLARPIGTRRNSAG